MFPTGPNNNRMPGYGPMYGPRHSSPNSPFHNNSPRPPNIGPILNHGTAPPPGPNMRLFGPASGTGPVAVPWGSGALQRPPFPPQPVAGFPPFPSPNMPAMQMPPRQQLHQPNMSSAPAPSQNPHSAPMNSSNRGRSHQMEKEQFDKRSRHSQDRDRDKYEGASRDRGNNDSDSGYSNRDPDRHWACDDRNRSQRGRSGAILRDDRDEDKSYRQGAILLDDRDDRLTDERDEFDYDRGSESRYRDRREEDGRDRRDYSRESFNRSRSKGDNSDSSRDYSNRDSYHNRGSDRGSERGSPRQGGAILREDRGYTPPTRDNRGGNASRETSNRGALLIDDRDDNSDRFDIDKQRDVRYKDDRDKGWGNTERGYSDGGRYNDRGGSRSDRDNFSVRDHRSDFRGRGKSNRNFSNPGRGHFSGRSERGRSNLSNHGEARTGKTGAILLEDRDEDRSSQRDVRIPHGNIGRTGAILREDREVGNSRGHQTQGRPDVRDHSRDRSSQKSFERSDSQQRSKRSRSPSRSVIGSTRGHSSSKDRDIEPKYKRRRTKDASEEKQQHCVRSGSPSVEADTEDTYVEPVSAWVRCSSADLYFTKDSMTGNLVTTKRMQDLETRFEQELIQRAARVIATQPPLAIPERSKPKWNKSKHCCQNRPDHHDNCSSSDSSDSSSSDSDLDDDEWMIEEMKRKQQYPNRLHPEVWFNEPGELNYGPLCRCSMKAQKSGIRHDKYPGEQAIPGCNQDSNNLDKLYHYKITVSPVINFLTKHPTVVMFDGHEYMFEGFSIFTHKKIPKLPPCQVIRFNIIYTIHIIEEQAPENFSIRSLDLLTKFLYEEILELVDIDWKGAGGDDQCRRFHVMPRFSRPFPENGKEVLSMNDVLLYLLKSSKPLLEPKELSNLLKLGTDEWQKFVDGFRHMVVTCPGKKPSSIRIDQLDKQHCTSEESKDKFVYPLIIHHGLRPAQLSYAGDPAYKKKWREYLKFRRLLWYRTKVTQEDKVKLDELEVELQNIRLKCTMKREVSAEVDSDGFLLTGIHADICQHAMLLPVLFGHVRFHECLGELEKTINYEFKDKSLLQLALTHSSYKINYGTNPDHGRNSLSNCGFRQLEFGDHRIHIQHTRKRGLNILLRIMSKMANKNEVRSEIPHNERLEFLGDAVVEFITSTHLFSMFPYADEGELTLYRGSLVQNAHLAVLADKLRLQDYLLYAHGPDLCHDSDLRHAMANCFEALMGALFLDGGIELADRVFSSALFDEPDLLDTWTKVPKHPLKIDEPNGDRHWIQNSPTLQKLLQFEEDIGYTFNHIRLLAKSFTQRNVGYNHLTLGHNQRLEFLGDTIMQLISSDFLFRHFPDHHEGHLTLLRSSVVNNKTQATVAEELGMTDFAINCQKKDWASNSELKLKEKADLLESLLGALFVDGGLEPAKVLCDVCFFPRLEMFILNQDWNDPKSQLQQCCLTLRHMNDESPDIPIYKVLSKAGPTNTRRYKVAVYFRSKRLAVGEGSSIQQGEMKAAETALAETKGLFHNRFQRPISLKQLQSRGGRRRPFVKQENTDTAKK